MMLKKLACICSNCMSEFTPTRRTARFCSEACRVAAYRYKRTDFFGLRDGGYRATQNNAPATVSPLSVTKKHSKIKEQKRRDCGTSREVGKLDWANSLLKRQGSPHRIVADASGLFRVQWADGSHSDILNLNRAVDAALAGSGHHEK
jgi:hypothetical protein